jgi:TRAP-type mannitol/chloroaromatic compound transport system permease small subunit
MRRDLLIAILLAVAAFPLGAALTAAPLLFEHPPQWLLEASFYGGGPIALALIAIAAIIAMRGDAEAAKKGRTRHMLPLIGMIVFGLGFIGCAIWYFWPSVPFSVAEETPMKPATELKKTEELPDVTLSFVGAASPALVLVNQSGVLAKQIKWIVVLWNMDDPRTYINPHPEPDVHDALPIPSATVDFLRPHTSSGPQNLFGQEPIYSYVKKGQHLFGSASVICAECARGHTYFVSIIFGEGGWYAEQMDRKEGELIVPATGKKDMVSAFYQTATASIPMADRITIAP